MRDEFFVECEDLVASAIEGLSAMADGARDTDTVNATFRAVHSIKGGAGAFGLDDLVAFTHGFETVLDQLRAGTLAFDDELMRLLQRAGDLMSDLVGAARDGTEIDSAAIATVSDALEAASGEPGGTDEPFTFEAIAAELDLEAGLPDFADLAAPAGLQTYCIEFVPTPDLYAMGHEPLVLIGALGDLGELEVEADMSRLPDLAGFDWEESYLSWRIVLKTSEPGAVVRDVFEFAEGLCELHITPVPQEPPDQDEQIPTPAPGQATAALDPPLADPPDPPPDPDAAPVSKPRAEPRATLRVDVDRIDRLINTVGELIINQAMLSQHVRELGGKTKPEVAADLEDYRQLARDIQEGVMGLRTQPVKPLFQRMTRIARETAEVASKLVRLEIEGEGTELDRKVIDKLADPLTHMIRNAIDHGIETPETREEAGKPTQGTVHLSARYRSGEVLIRIADDGAGLHRERIRRTAVDKGLIREDVALTDGEIDALLFKPGFSTASSVTSLSGRGVGMDVVGTAIEALGGRISIASTPGGGSAFSIVLPLTLAVLDGMLVRVNDEAVIVPITSIEEAIRPRKDDLARLGTGGCLFSSRGDYVPVIDLAERLGHERLRSKVTEQTLLLVRSGGARAALAVDGVIDKRQVVVKSLAKNYRSVPGISAATILGNGKVALIVDAEAVASVVDGATPMAPPVEAEATTTILGGSYDR